MKRFLAFKSFRLTRPHLYRPISEEKLHVKWLIGMNIKHLNKQIPGQESNHIMPVADSCRNKLITIRTLTT